MQRFVGSYIGSIKLILFCLLLVPAVMLLIAAIQNTLGPDPAEALADATGEWALRILLLTLAITPLRSLTRVIQLTQFKRMLGLFAFFYASLHLLIFLAFLLGWQWRDFWQELGERPYITVGFAAFILMAPLALTSTIYWRRRLGKYWRSLHQLIYLSASLAMIHLWWQVRSDWSEALVYTLIFSVLVLLRIGPKKSVNTFA